MKKDFELELVIPTKKYCEQLEEYKQKFVGCQSEIVGVGIHGCGTLGQKHVLAWLQECDDHRMGKNLPEGFVPATQFLGIRKADDKLVGVFQIRHSLTPHLKRIGGHIGYSVAPDQRRKGYATEMLLLGLGECRKLGIDRVRVSCIKENTASASVILKCGGKYDGKAEYDGKIFERYWIDLKSFNS